MFSSTVYKRRIWVASTSSSDSLYYYPLTSQYGNITGDTDYKFQSGGSFITPWYHIGFKADTKAWVKLVLTMEDTTANIYWEAHYQKVGDAAWTDIGDFKTSPTTSKFLPVDSSSNKPSSTMMRFKFVPITNDTAKTPILKTYDIRGIWYPAIRKLLALQARVADGLPTKDGSEQDETASSIRAGLDEALNPTTAWPIAFYPPYYESAGDTKYVKLIHPYKLEIKSGQVGENTEYVCDLLLEEVTLA